MYRIQMIIIIMIIICNYNTACMTNALDYGRRAARWFVTTDCPFVTARVTMDTLSPAHDEYVK